MTPAAYKTERKKVGTQSAVADLLGVSRYTIINRENGMAPITPEAALAICALAVQEAHSKRR